MPHTTTTATATATPPSSSSSSSSESASSSDCSTKTTTSKKTSENVVLRYFCCYQFYHHQLLLRAELEKTKKTSLKALPSSSSFLSDSLTLRLNKEKEQRWPPRVSKERQARALSLSLSAPRVWYTMYGKNVARTERGRILSLNPKP